MRGVVRLTSEVTPWIGIGKNISKRVTARGRPTPGALSSTRAGRSRRE
jgi:hypothetical protein